MNTGNNLIYLIVAAFLGFMAVSGFFGKRNLSGLDVCIEMPPEIYAGAAAPVRVNVRNEKRFFPGFLLMVELEGKELVFPYIDGRAETARTIEVSFARRGKQSIRDLRVFSVFPFNFFVRSSEVSAGAEFVVFPSLIPCNLRDPGGGPERRTGNMILDAAGYDADMLSIREYVQGDPLKHVHWKATAKTGSLKTKELAASADLPVIVDLESMPGRDLEERLGCAAFSIQTLIRRKRSVGLRIGKRVFASDCSDAHKLHLLRELACHGIQD